MIPKNQSVLLRYLIRCFCDISIGVFELITNHLVLQVASAGARVVAADSCDTYTVSLWRHPDRGPTSGSQASNNPLPFHREHLNGIQIFSVRIHIQAFLPRHEHLRPHPKDSIQFLKVKVRESFGRYCDCFAHLNFRRYGFEGESLFDDLLVLARSSAHPSPRPCRRKSLHRPLTDQLTLELAHSAEDGVEEPSLRSGRIEPGFLQ